MNQYHYSNPEDVTLDQLQNALLEIDSLNISQINLNIQFNTLQQKQIFNNFLDQDLDIGDDSEDEEVQRCFFEMNKLEKEIIIFLREYQSVIKKIEANYNAEIIFTTKKIKIFADDQSTIDLCMKEIEDISKNISIHKLNDNGSELFSSQIYEKYLLPIKIVKIKDLFYLYFNKSQIEREEVEEKIKKIKQQYKHSLFYLPPISIYFYQRSLIQSLFAEYLDIKILPKLNSAEQLLNHIQISKDRHAFLLHQKVQNYTQDKKMKILNHLNETFVFFINSNQITDFTNVKKKIDLVKNYMVHQRTFKKGKQTNGFIIKKKDLQQIMNNQKHTKNFGKIFVQMYNATNQMFEIGFYNNNKQLIANIKKHCHKYLASFLRKQQRIENILRLAPKYLDQQNPSQMYLQSLQIVLKLYKQQKEQSVAYVSSLDITKSLNQTSMLDMTSNELPSIINESTFILPNQVQKSIKQQYVLNWNCISNYVQLANDNTMIRFYYQIGPRDNQIKSKICEITNALYKVFKINIALRHKPKINYVFNRTLVVGQNYALKEDVIHLYKIQHGFKKTGFLVQANVEKLQDQGKYFLCKSPQDYIITHRIEYIQ